MPKHTASIERLLASQGGPDPIDLSVQFDAFSFVETADMGYVQFTRTPELALCENR